MIDPDGIRQRYAALSSILDERGRRLLVAAEAKAAGYGGIAAVWRATGVATRPIWRGLRELAEAAGPTAGAGRCGGGGGRHGGGGRKPAVVLVAGDRATALPWGQEPDHHGRWGRLERRAGAAVEA